MNERRIILGIDTSNYTTSASLMYEDGELIANIKKPLSVANGERGLRQSEAVFSHIKNTPDLMQEVAKHLNGRAPSAIGVSERPRNIDGSYMPCFLSGVAVAEAISAATGAPIYKFSHQCGHIMAALYSSGSLSLIGEEFAALHVSGGTTELLRVKGFTGSFDSELVGGTKDLNAGQVIDRVGVRLGMPFPAGPHLEAAALSYTGRIPSRKVSVDGLEANLSGLENLAAALFDKSKDVGLTAAFVFEYIGNTIVSLCRNYVERYGDAKFVFAGGVMCNSIIRQRLQDAFEAYFAEPQLSSDNAVGVAELTRLNFIN